MVKKTQVILIDDIDGSNADETVTFALDGVEYEIDLSDSNASALRDALNQYISVATRVGGRKQRAKSGTAAQRPGTSRSAKIREWARENGIEVNRAGRIPTEIVQRYEQENS